MVELNSQRDPGLQAERTSLAWSRTSLALAANAILILRTAITERHLPLILVAGVIGLAAAGIWVGGHVRGQQLLRVARAVDARLTLAVALLACLAVAAGLTSIAARHLR